MLVRASLSGWVGDLSFSCWKKQILENGHQIFENSVGKEVSNLNNKIKDLERMLGKKEVELNLLKNFSDFYQSKNMT